LHLRPRERRTLCPRDFFFAGGLGFFAESSLSGIPALPIALLRRRSFPLDLFHLGTRCQFNGAINSDKTFSWTAPGGLPLFSSGIQVQLASGTVAAIKLGFF
jgi:hypothetical protein